MIVGRNKIIKNSKETELALDNRAGAAGEGEFKLLGRGDDAEFFLAGEGSGGLDFWEHRARGEVAGGDVIINLARGEEAESDLVGATEIKIGVRDGSDGNKNISFDKLGELLGGEVFVDNGVDTFEDFEDFRADDRNTAAANGDDDGAGIDEGGDFAAFDDVERLWRRYDATITATSIFAHFPTSQLGEFDGFFRGVELTNGFRWVFEGGVRFIDNDLSDDADDFLSFMFPGEGVADGLGEPVADLTLTHGDGSFERHSGSGFGGGRFFVNEDIADLGTVAVGDDDFVFV